MNPEQFSQLLRLLEKIVSQQYTLTGAADWPILVIVGAAFSAVLGFMWRDLRTVIKDNRSEWKVELEKYKAENVKEHDNLWKAHYDCQHECCPRRKENQ